MLKLCYFLLLFLFIVNLMKNFDSIPLAKAAKENDVKGHEGEEEEDNDAEWDEPSSCEEVYSKYIQKTDADGKPVLWKV